MTAYYLLVVLYTILLRVTTNTFLDTELMNCQYSFNGQISGFGVNILDIFYTRAGGLRF